MGGCQVCWAPGPVDAAPLLEVRQHLQHAATRDQEGEAPLLGRAGAGLGAGAGVRVRVRVRARARARARARSGR